MSKGSKSRLLSVTLFRAMVVALFVLLVSLSANAQTPQQPNTDSSIDNRMRSDATVDPLTLSLQLSINLGSYPGRNGLALPVTMNYSSHLWGVHHVTTDRCGMSPYWEYYYRYRPEYGRGSMAGWTSPLGMSDMLGTVNLELYDILGHPVSTGAYKKIARMFATLPDGSRHELRKDDSLHDPLETITGKFYAVDDSRLVYDTTTSTLYLPDGTRIASGFIDKNGNKLVAGGGLGTDWTDTMGRSVSSPLDTGSNKVGDNTSAVAFDKSFSVPGFNGGTLSYTMKWRKLQDVLTNTSDTLEYMGDTGNSGTCGSYYPPASPSLFVSTGDETKVLMSTRVFNPVVLAEIDLPNGTSYKFTYNIYGEIDKVVYPTGAYDKFAYAEVAPLNPGLYDGDPFFTQTNRGVISRTQSEDGTTATEVTWTYAQGGRSVTNPDGTSSSITVYPGTFASAMKWGFESVIAGLPSAEATYNSSGTMLTRHLIDRTYDSVTVAGVAATRNPRVTREISVKFEPGDANALVSLVTYDYDSNANPAYFANLNPTVIKQYNYVVVSASTAQTASSATLAGYFSSSAPAKQVETDYLYDPNYLARNLTQVPTEVRIKDGSGNVKAKTHFYYDESSYQSTTSGTMPTAASGTWIDPLAELGSTIGAVRALPTTIRSYYDVTNGYYIDTHKFYDQYGNVTKVRDGRGNDTTSAFDASYAFTLPTSGITPVPDSSGTYGSSTAFTSSTAYDYSSGLPTSSTDINGQTTTVSYADPSTSVLDPLLRPRVITAPNGQQTITEYGDTSGSLYIKVSSQIDSSNWKVGYKYFDNLGRTIRTRLVDAAGDDYTLTCYDNMGRVSKVTNPFRGYSTQTCATTTGLDWTSTTYDAGSRVTTITTPDTAQVTTAYALATSGGVIGTAVTVTDQVNKSRKSVTDAFGRLTTVYEDPASLNYATSYSYDTLDNLTGVTQGSQTRFFMYDSLKRLIRSRNPEQGTLPGLSLTDPTTGNSAWSIGYAYEANGNLAQKTDARGVVSTYVYDALNRNLTIDYSDTSVNPDVTRLYDGAVHGSGRLWKSYAGGNETNGSNVERAVFDSYDALGRPLVLNQSFKLNNEWKPYQITRTYNLAGQVLSQGYPSQHFVNYNYDNAGRLANADETHLAFTGNLGDGSLRTYSRDINYTSAGQMTQEKFGTTTTAVYNKLFYNKRQQLAEILVSTTVGNTYDRGRILNGYSLQCSGAGCNTTDNNGNLRKQQIDIPTTDQATNFVSWYQQYEYDALNRLQSVREVAGSNQLWRQWFSYDRWGNRTIDTTQDPGDPNPRTYGTGINNTAFQKDDLTNRLYAPGDLALPDNQKRISYDAAGNQIRDIYTGYGTAAFDADNHITAIQDKNGGTSNYTYNADGQRTRRKTGNQETWQIFGMDGELLAEYPASGATNAPQKEYGYRNGQLLITASPGSGPSSLSLNGSSAYAEVPNSSSLNIAGPITMEAWIKLPSVSTSYQPIIDHSPSLGNQGGYDLFVTDTGKARMDIFYGPSYQWLIGTTTLTPNVWHHIAGVYDGSQLRLYVDGQLDGSVNLSSPMTGTAVQLRIGRNNYLYTPIYFNGLIDEVRISAGALYSSNFTPAASLTASGSTKGLWKFDGQTVSDSSANANNGTLNGGTYSTDVPTGPSTSYYSGSFNGSSAYVEVPNSSSLNIAGPITMEAWIKLPAVPTSYQPILDHSPSLGNEGGYDFFVTDTGKARMDIFYNPSYQWLIGATTLSPNVWHHIAGVYDGSQLRLYVDGQLDGSVNLSSPMTGTAVQLRIGRNNYLYTPIYFTGLIDEVRISNAALYSSSFTPQTHLTASGSTKGLWKFDSQNTNDSSGNGNNGTLQGATYSADVPSGDGGGGGGSSSGTATQIQWLVTDHLGTPRMVIDQTGSVAGIKRHDYLPFGEELHSQQGLRTESLGYAAGDGVRQQFTEKERDTETGLDYFGARYFASTQGRFTSTDPIFFQLMMTLDPQRFNLYAYARNNPLKFIDPNGERVYLRGDSDWLRNNVLYEMVGGQEDFDKYFQITDGQVVLRDGVDLSTAGAGVQQLAGLVNATDNYVYFAGTDGAAAADQFQGSRNAKGELTRSGKDTAGDFTCAGNRIAGCGTVVGTAGRSESKQPANLANGDPVFAVIAYNQNVVITQTNVAYKPTDLTQIAITGCSAPECTAQKSGVGQAVRPVSFFIHESTENQEFARQGRGLLNYQGAHLHAIHREAVLRRELRITGGFAGGALDVRIPKKK